MLVCVLLVSAAAEAVVVRLDGQPTLLGSRTLGRLVTRTSAAPGPPDTHRPHPAAAQVGLNDWSFDFYQVEAKYNLQILPSSGDGNCFFHSLGRLLGEPTDAKGTVDARVVADLRALAFGSMLLPKNAKYFEDFLPFLAEESLAHYATRMNRNGEWADLGELQTIAAALAIGRPIRLITIFEGGSKAEVLPVDFRGVNSVPLGGLQGKDVGCAIIWCKNHYVAAVPRPGSPALRALNKPVESWAAPWQYSASPLWPKENTWAQIRGLLSEAARGTGARAPAPRPSTGHGGRNATRSGSRHGGPTYRGSAVAHGHGYRQSAVAYNMGFNSKLLEVD